jgi:hypothetical protein
LRINLSTQGESKSRRDELEDHGETLFRAIRAKSLDSFAPLLIRLKRAQDEMHSVLGAVVPPITDKVTARQVLSQDDVNNCHDLLGDLVDNESEPETGYSGLGAGADVFSINVMNFGDVVYMISDLEFDDIGYFSLGRAKELRRSLNSIRTHLSLLGRKTRKMGSWKSRLCQLKPPACLNTLAEPHKLVSINWPYDSISKNTTNEVFGVRQRI